MKYLMTVGRELQSHARLVPSRCLFVLGEKTGYYVGLGRAGCRGVMGSPCAPLDPDRFLFATTLSGP